MQDTDSTLRKTFAGVMILVIAIVLLKAGIASADIRSIFAGSGNDDVMRLVVIRDWLGGQGWYDPVQYRLMPPEGVVMHWSRYLDAAIAAIIVPLSWFVPIDTAEMWAVAIWPTLLMVILVVVVGFGTRRIFGAGPACFAMACAVFWPFTSDFYFSIGRIDHHNVQVLMLVIMTLAAIWPDRARGAGILCGIAAAFSLAIGLEILLYILAIGALLFVRAVFQMAEGATGRLLAFCLAVLGAGVVFWLGQTAPSRLWLPMCDQLGTPILSAIAIAVAASIVGCLPFIRRPWIRLGLSIAVTIAGCALVWPLLGPCLAGPYATLPQAVQDIISGAITEGLPATVFAVRFPFLYNHMMTPVAGALLIALWGWWSDRKGPAADVVGQLLLLSLVGLLASLSQIRLLSMTSAAVVLLAGYGLWALFLIWRRTRLPVDAAKMLGAGVVILAPVLIDAPLKNLMRGAPSGTASGATTCRDFEAMTALNAIPAADVLTPMNLGPLMLLTTHHSVLSGPYHRSPDAFANGLLPFQMSEAEMKPYVQETGADYLLLCRGARSGDGFATELANGAAADWLRLVNPETEAVMMFEILPSDL